MHRKSPPAYPRISHVSCRLFTTTCASVISIACSEAGLLYAPDEVDGLFRRRHTITLKELEPASQALASRLH